MVYDNIANSGGKALIFNEVLNALHLRQRVCRPCNKWNQIQCQVFCFWRCLKLEAINAMKICMSLRYFRPEAVVFVVPVRCGSAVRTGMLLYLMWLVASDILIKYLIFLNLIFTATGMLLHFIALPLREVV